MRYYNPTIIDLLKESEIQKENKNKANNQDEFNLIDDIIKQSIADIISGNAEYLTRYIYRQYSKIFNTPLHQVYELPFIWVLKEYLEYKLETEWQNLDQPAEKIEFIYKYVKFKTDEEEAKDLEEYIEFVKQNFIKKT